MLKNYVIGLKMKSGHLHKLTSSRSIDTMIDLALKGEIDTIVFVDKITKKEAQFTSVDIFMGGKRYG